MELSLLYTGIIIFVLYCIAAIVLNGWNLPESISATSYLSKDKFSTTAPFTIICIICAVCLFPAWIAVSPENLQFLTFLSCAGMLFAGSTPLYKEELASKVHYTGGIVAFVCGLLWLVFTSNWTTISVIAIIGTVWTYFNKKNYTFIFETIGYLSTAIAVLRLL